jgi:hypothetical protein
MSAKWRWNAVNIYVTDEDSSREIQRAEIKKLDATESSFHFFGATSRKIALKGTVIGATDRDTIWTDAINDTARTLTTPYGNIVNCKINGAPKFSDIKYAGGTMDGTFYSAETTQLFSVELEIIVVV